MNEGTSKSSHLLQSQVLTAGWQTHFIQEGAIKKARSKKGTFLGNWNQRARQIKSAQKSNSGVN